MSAHDALAELRQLITVEGPLDLHRCRRLVLRATSCIADLHNAADLIKELTAEIPAIELMEICGHDRQKPLDRVRELLDEIERLTRPN